MNYPGYSQRAGRTRWLPGRLPHRRAAFVKSAVYCGHQGQDSKSFEEQTEKGFFFSLMPSAIGW